MPTPHHRGPPLADQDLVEDHEDERGEDEQAGGEVAQGHGLDDEGGVAEDEPGHPPRRRPGREAPAGHPAPPGAQARGERQGQRGRHEGPERPGHRGHRQAGQRSAGVGQEVHAPGRPQPGGGERVEAVGQGVGGPGDEPDLLAGVETGRSAPWTRRRRSRRATTGRPPGTVKTAMTPRWTPSRRSHGGTGRSAPRGATSGRGRPEVGCGGVGYVKSRRPWPRRPSRGLRVTLLRT